MAAATTSTPRDLLDLVGGTPLLPLDTGTSSPRVRLFGKMEGQNPGGSVKDRPARRMILGAEERGLLKPGVRLIEPTSGNTGIALAMIAAARGYAIDLVMPETATAERVKLMRAFGAEVVLTPGGGGMEQAIDVAHERVARGILGREGIQEPPDCRVHLGDHPVVARQVILVPLGRVEAPLEADLPLIRGLLQEGRQRGA